LKFIAFSDSQNSNISNLQYFCVSVQIVTRSHRSLTIDLVHREESTGSNRGSNHGKLTVHAEECVSSKTTTEMIFRCSDLESKDLFSRSVWAASC
jgi:hypothetical protein